MAPEQHARLLARQLIAADGSGIIYRDGEAVGVVKDEAEATRLNQLESALAQSQARVEVLEAALREGKELAAILLAHVPTAYTTDRRGAALIVLAAAILNHQSQEARE